MGKGVGLRPSLRLGTQHSALSIQPSALSNRFSRRARRGVSLMEVLISIFVILFGMLGVAALLPVGRFEMSMCLRADRAGNAGRAALREAQVRGMTNPYQWIAWYDGANPYPNWNQTNACQVYTPGWFPVPRVVTDATGNVTQEYEQYLQHYQAYAIDPLFIAQARTVDPNAGPLIARFPYGAANGTAYMGRVSFGIAALNNTALFDRIFTWQDDLVFDYPSEKTLRPRLLWRNVDGSTSTNLSPGAATAVRENKYSWMMTVTPADNEYGLHASTRKLYTLSVVVFYSRLLTPEGELSCNVAAPGSLIGGGDVLLGGANAVEVKPREWILLRGMNPNTGRLAFKWYRVIAADEFDPVTSTRRVTLAGPDWTDINNYQLQAGIFPGAIGVYTETVELER